MLPPDVTRCRGHEVPLRGHRLLQMPCEKRDDCRRFVAIQFEPPSAPVYRHPGLCVAGGKDWFMPLVDREVK